jgi:hypothetical protein
VASVDIPKAIAISDNVSPVIIFISAIIADLFNFRNYGYYTKQNDSSLENILKNIRIFGYYILIYYPKLRIIINR